MVVADQASRLPVHDDPLGELQQVGKGARLAQNRKFQMIIKRTGRNKWVCVWPSGDVTPVSLSGFGKRLKMRWKVTDRSTGYELVCGMYVAV